LRHGIPAKGKLVVAEIAELAGAARRSGRCGLAGSWEGNGSADGMKGAGGIWRCWTSLNAAGDDDVV
jgi:hypothetical protein